MTPLATPAWYADRLLVGCFDNRLYAVAASGAPLWNFKAEGRIYSSPTPDGDEVYFGSDDGRVYRVDLDSGVLLWEYEAGGQVRGATAVADGTVYAISGDGRLHAIDKERGKALWTAPLSPHTRTSPVVAGESAAGGASVLTLDEAGVARSHHAATGELRWEAGLGARSLLSPVVAGNLVLLPSDRGRIAARSLENGAPLWQRDLGLEISGQPFATETQLVVPTGDGVAVLRLADGGDDATVAGLEGIRDRIISVVPQGERLWVLLAAGVSKPYVGHTHFATHYGSVQLWEPVPEPAPQEGP
jgi:outer membrane protein assembly factor BamB